MADVKAIAKTKWIRRKTLATPDGNALGKEPFTGWGAKRLINQHNDSMAFNLRLSQLLKSHKEDLLNGYVPWTAGRTKRSARLDKIETAVGAAIALGGVGLVLAKKIDPAAVGLISGAVGGFTVAKYLSIVERMRHSPENTLLAFVAPAKLQGPDRERHSGLIDQAVTNLTTANETHKLHIAALRGYLASKADWRERTAAEKKAKAAETARKVEEKRVAKGLNAVERKAKRTR